jgi:hypothetical protein
MAAELKILVVGGDAALKQIAAIEAAYDRLAQKSIALQKDASEKRVAIAKDEVAKLKAEYGSVRDPLAAGGSGRGGKGGGRSGGLGGIGGGGDSTGLSGGAVAAAGLAAGAFVKALDMAVDGLKAFSGFLINDVVKPQLQLEKFATQLSNSTRGQIHAQTIVDKSNAIQLKWNIEANDAAAAMGSLQDKTGRVDLSMGSMDQLAELSKAYGVELSDLVEFTGAVATKNKGKSKDEILGIVRQTLAASSEEGGQFSLKEIAATGGKMFTRNAMLAGGDQKAIATLGAYAQVTGTAGSLDESITNTNALIADAYKLTQSRKLKASNVLDKEDSNKINFEGYLIELMNKSVRTGPGGAKVADMAKLSGLGLSSSSISAVAPIVSTFSDAMKKTGGDVKKSQDMALESFRRLRDANITEEEVSKAAAKNMQTSAEQWDTAINTVRDALLGVMPDIKDIISLFAENAKELADGFSVVAKGMVELMTWLAKKFGEDTSTTEGRAAKAGREAARSKVIEHRAEGLGVSTEVIKEYQDVEAKKAGAKEKFMSWYAGQESPWALSVRTATPGLWRDKEETRKDNQKWMYQEIENLASMTQDEASARIQELQQRGLVTKEQAGKLTELKQTETGISEGKASNLIDVMMAMQKSIADQVGAMKENTEALKSQSEGIPGGPIGGGANGGKK